MAESHIKTGGGGMKAKKTWSIIRNILIVVFTILMSLPIYLLIVNTFKHGSDIENHFIANRAYFSQERNIIPVCNRYV